MFPDTQDKERLVYLVTRFHFQMNSKIHTSIISRHITRGSYPLHKQIYLLTSKGSCGNQWDHRKSTLHRSKQETLNNGIAFFPPKCWYHCCLTFTIWSFNFKNTSLHAKGEKIKNTIIANMKSSFLSFFLQFLCKTPSKSWVLPFCCATQFISIIVSCPLPMKSNF